MTIVQPPAASPAVAAEITEAEIGALVEAFYGKARLDPVIGPIFARAIEDWPAHFTTLKDFWSSIMRKTGRYKGNPFMAHVGKGIEPAFFDRWLALWRVTTLEVVGPEKGAFFVAKAEKMAESLKAGLFFAEPAR